MSRINLTKESSNDPAVQKIFEEIKEKADEVPAAYRAFARHYHILQANWNRTKNILGEGNISIEIKEFIAARVSKVNGCHFCSLIKRKNLEDLGLSINEIDDIENATVKDEKLKFTLDFVSTATKNPEKLTDGDFDRLKAYGYGDDDILEILTVMEMYTGYNKIIVALDLQPED